MAFSRSSLNDGFSEAFKPILLAGVGGCTALWGFVCVAYWLQGPTVLCNLRRHWWHIFPKALHVHPGLRIWISQHAGFAAAEDGLNCCDNVRDVSVEYMQQIYQTFGQKRVESRSNLRYSPGNAERQMPTLLDQSEKTEN